MARTRTRRVSGKSSKRVLIWLALELDPVTVAANTGVLLGSLNAAALALAPFTVIRTRGIFTFRSDQIADAEQFAGAIGMQVVTQQAVGAGIGSIPTPLAEADSDFFLYENYFGSTLDGGGAVQVHESQVQRVFDSKAMRKVDKNDNIAITAEATALAGTSVGVYGRILIALH